MPMENKNRTRRIRNLVVVSAMTAIILSVSTYAWFVGMQTVNVTSFDVEIKTTDSLLLSLNGADWGEQVTINKALLEANDPSVTYAGHTNSWGTGLVPVSTIGEMDSGVSRMKLYEKASLTATPGGYRLMASQVLNYGQYTQAEDDADGAGGVTVGTARTEYPGYVAFDLFIKNYSGTQYITDLVPDDEEAIYLTKDSKVSVALDGGVAGTGIENSVRVAFAQIGRVIGTTNTVATITGITCSSDANVTGICRKAQIWEPNDQAHVINAINWYNTSCRSRTAHDVDATEDTNITLTGSYGAAGTCEEVKDKTAYPTYAIAGEIVADDRVDIYDGPAYNTYEHLGWTDETNSLLYAYPYFTDTAKLLTGVQRPKFMDLAPNSITKVRVYIYIEGQDIDNYDFASIGKKISVAFGFTKERFSETDIDYNGAPLDPDDDQTPPVITLTGNATETVTLAEAATYVDDGATAHDNLDGDVVPTLAPTSDDITKVTEAGTYYVVWAAVDAHGNPSTKMRTITVTE